MVHTALKIQADLLNKPGHDGFNISEAIDCIPDSLYMFLRLLFGGQKVLEEMDENNETSLEQEDKVQQKCLSIVQDIVFNVSGGKKMTPAGCALHQQTRSKKLVNLFSRAGHVISYDRILQIDTALAEHTLSTMDVTTGSVMPPGLVRGTFVHYTADNIDILDETLDGKNTFHATQLAAWQRGSYNMDVLKTLQLGKRHQIDVPHVMKTLTAANVFVGKENPTYESVNLNWFTKPMKDTEVIASAKAADLAFIIKRHEIDCKPSWTIFNQFIDQTDQEETSVVFFPIINAPAPAPDTLNTVIQRCMYVSSKLNQSKKHYTIG